jgi:flagellar basal body-associated protein FliL
MEPKKRNIILVTISIILLLAAAGTYAWMRNASSNNNENTATEDLNAASDGTYDANFNDNSFEEDMYGGEALDENASADEENVNADDVIIDNSETDDTNQ